MEFVIEFISQYGYWAIAILLALGIIGLPVPDETLMIFVGYMSSTGVLNYMISILVSFVGSVTGMMISYLIGKKLGVSVIAKYGKWVGLTPKRFDKAQQWFSRYGIWTIMFSYFIPGVRHATGYISGISKMSFRKYLVICSTVAVIWTILFISIGYFIGWKLI